MSGLSETDLMALRFLASNGPDCVGIIDDEDKLAAALLYCDLEKRRLITVQFKTADGPVWAITAAGRAALAWSTPPQEL